jgi:hypothetical protein
MNEIEVLSKELGKELTDEQNKVFMSVVKVKLVHGKRVWWYHQEDADFYKEEGLDPREMAPYSGLLLAAPFENPRSELEPEDCFVVMDRYPCEKCDVEICYAALSRVLDSPGLVEIFEK